MIGSTETKYIKLNTKTKKQKQKKVFFFKVYTKVECYKKKEIWVLVFSFMYLVSVDPMDRTKIRFLPNHTTVQHCDEKQIF